MPNLRALEISNIHIPEHVYDEFASFSALKRLQFFFIEKNDLHLSGLRIIEGLCHFNRMRLLDLNDINMTGEMADKLAVAIPNMKSLQQLWLRNNNLWTDKVIAIAQSLSMLTTLLQLNLAGNQITKEAADTVASAIHSNGALKKLYLSDNDLQGGALTIVKSLKYVSALKELFLDNNNIPDEVFVELANIFATMNLEVLDLSFNFCNCQERLFQKVCVVSTPSLLYV